MIKVKGHCITVDEKWVQCSFSYCDMCEMYKKYKDVYNILNNIDKEYERCKMKK